MDASPDLLIIARTDARGIVVFDSAGNLILSTGDDTNPFQWDGYTPIVSTPVLGATTTVTTTTLQTADASEPRQTALQRRYAAQDRTIEPKVFHLPDLGSEREYSEMVRVAGDRTAPLLIATI
mgnify:CR=1 FL=1